MLATTHILDILEQAKIEPPKARAIARAFEEAEKNISDQTKTYIAETCISKKEGSDLSLQMEHVYTELGKIRLEMSELRAEMSEFKSDIIKWVVGIITGQAIIVLGGVYFIVTHILR